MPKVDAAYRNCRRSQILFAALHCFARNGFHKTSMQDICREAKLSPGAVYLYFKSKDKLIEALAAEGRSQTANSLAQCKGKNLPEALAQLLEPFNVREGVPSFRADVGLWAEAIHTPRLKALFQQSVATVLDSLSQVVTSAAPRSTAEEAQTAAQLLVAVISGFELQKVMNPELDLGPAITLLKAIFQEIRSKRRNPPCSKMRPRREPC